MRDPLLKIGRNQKYLDSGFDDARMRVLLIANNFPPIIGGSAVVYDNICRRLRGPVEVLAPYLNYRNGLPIPEWKETDEKQPYPVERVKLLRPRIRGRSRVPGISYWRYIQEDIPLWLRLRKQVLDSVERFRPDVVCLGELHALAPLGAIVRRGSLAATIHFIHGEEITTEFSSRQMRKDAQQAFDEADAFIAVSSFTRARLEKLGIESSRLHTVVNGVDSSRFTPGPWDASLINRYNLAGKRVLLTVARLEERKGHDTVLRAMPAILARVPNAVYLIVGSGGYEDRLRAIASQLGLGDSVIFAGSVPEAELVEHFRTCDLFIMPNRTLSNGDTEGFGLVFLEAGACGKPVIGGMDGGVPDAISDGQTGLLVDGRSVESVAAAAAHLLSDGEYSERLGQAGRARAESADWSVKVDDFVSAARAAITRARNRAQ